AGASTVAAGDFFNTSSNPVVLHFTGTAEDAKKITVSLDGQPFVYAMTLGETLPHVVSQLATLINNHGYTAIPVGNTLSITKTAGGNEVGVRVSNTSTSIGALAATATGTLTNDHYSSVKFDLGGTAGSGIAIGASWTVTLDGKAYTFVAGSDGKATLI